MDDTTRGSYWDSLKEWRKFIIVVVLLLFTPYRIIGSTSSNSLNIDSLFYAATFGEEFSYNLKPLFLLSVLNLILIIIPSIYFNYRKISKYDNESIESLGLIISLLTLTVLAIISHQSYSTPNQIDISSSPTPNLQFLPGFALLLIFFTIFVPILKSLYVNSTSYSDQSYFKRFLPQTATGWLLIFLIILPSGITISSLNASTFDLFGSISLEILAAYFSGSIDILHYSQFTIITGSISLGGIIALFNMLTCLLWNSLLVIMTVGYLMEKISYRMLIFGGLLSIVPHLFLMILSLLFSIGAGFITSFYIPLPLLQFGVIIITRKEAYLKKMGGAKSTKMKRLEFVKVPFAYIITSSFRRISRGFRRENEKHLENSLDTKSDKEIS